MSAQVAVASDDNQIPQTSGLLRGQPSNFSTQDCHTCAILSAIAYDDEDPAVLLARLKAETKCKEVLWLFKENDTTVEDSRRFDLGGFVTKDDQHIYIVFRGTSSKANAITDIRIAMVPTSNRKLPFLQEFVGSRTDEEFESWIADSTKEDETLDTKDRTMNCLSGLCLFSKPKEAWLHKGFAFALSSVFWDMEKRVKEFLKESPLPIIVTGHSLGGASAMLLTFHATYPIKAVYTFGQPRVGGPSFANLYQRKRLDEKTFRLIKDQDIVSRAPPVSSGYRHVGRSLYMPSGGAKPIWDPSFLSLWQLGFNSCFNEGPRGIRDHGTKGYVEETKRLLAGAL